MEALRHKVIPKKLDKSPDYAWQNSRHFLSADFQVSVS